MTSQLEELILTGLHQKALANNIDLNNLADFTKFMDHLQVVQDQAKRAVTQLVEHTNCGCQKTAKPKMIQAGGETPQVYESQYTATLEIK